MKTQRSTLVLALCLGLIATWTSCELEGSSAPGTLQPVLATHPDDEAGPGSATGHGGLLPAPVAGLQVLVTALPFELDELPLHQTYEVRVRARDAQGAEVALSLPVELRVTEGGEACSWLVGGVLLPGTEALAATTNQPLRLLGRGPSRAFPLSARLLEARPQLTATAAAPAVPYPPAWGTLGYDPVASQIGGAYWRLHLAAHFWDPFSHDVTEPLWVRWLAHLPDEQPIVVLEEEFTQIDAGSTSNGLLYHCQLIGDTLQGLWAELPGLVLDESQPSGWRLDMLRACIADPADPGSFLRLPFQVGSRDDNLSLALQYITVEFQPNCGGPDQQVEVLAQVTLIDGYGCPVSGFDVQLWSDAGGVFTPDQVRTDGNGTASTLLTVDSGVLPNLNLPCPPPHADCWRMGAYTLNIGATLLPDAAVQSNDCSVTLSQPCPGGEN